jgi:citrate/tricarballylate utilization protein
VSSIEVIDLRRGELHDEARRAMEVCNACRYCEGYCAVFPAMELRRDFSDNDLDYLANLCHNCQGCYHSCQYAPPHPFGINVPKAFAELRLQTYQDYAWPQPMARVFARNGTLVCLLAALCVALAVIGTIALRDPALLFATQTGPGAFYRIMPWGLMVAFAGVTFIYALVALAMGFRNFWRASERPTSDLAKPRPLAKALHDVFTLKYLGGGGHGCNDADDTFSQTRRRLHHLMFYGFLLCFASTSVATIYDHFFDLPAPYPFFSLPVLLGFFGGLGLFAGTAGLIWVKIVSDPAPMAKRVLGADYALLTLLMLAAATGLLLLALRATPAMGVLLAVHLGFILALFLALPYSKFVHGIYRSGALLRFALEREPKHVDPPRVDASSRLAAKS